MNPLVVFGLVSLLLAWLCRYQLANPRCHGFYRFFAFEGVLWNLLHALPVWTSEPQSARQIASFTLMLAALAILIDALRRLGAAGRQFRRETRENFAFENTVSLATAGIYRYIRHPMYSSLLLFAWGLWLKRPTVGALLVTLVISLALWLTARVEEGENRAFFGLPYDDYRKHSKMLIPFIF
ncbi:MAG: methyltransferase family protein [Parahaliea sp.]